MDPALFNLLTLIKWVFLLALLMTTPYVAFHGLRTFDNQDYEKEFGQTFQLMTPEKELNDHPTLPILEKSNMINLPINSTFMSLSVKNQPLAFLCKLNISSRCESYQVAEVIETFWIVSPVYAPYQHRITIRYQSHKNFGDYVRSIGMPYSQLEAIRKDRNQKYLMTQPGKEPYDIQLQFYDDGYLRENLLNVAAKKIPGWEYMGWIDAHHLFENNYWWEESIVRMEKYPSMQLFQRFNGLTTKTNHTQIDWTSVLYKSKIQYDLDMGLLGFYGNAYGIKKEFYDQMGYIFDKCVGGCCDCAYAKASFGDSRKFEYFRTWSRYTHQMDFWINATAKVFNKRYNIVRGTIWHIPHEETFPYLSILGMFNNSDFQIDRDLGKDENGTIRLLNKAVKSKVEFWVFLYSFAVPIIVGSIVFGVFAGLCILYCFFRWRANRAKTVTTRVLNTNDSSLQ